MLLMICFRFYVNLLYFYFYPGVIISRGRGWCIIVVNMICICVIQPLEGDINMHTACVFLTGYETKKIG